MEGFKDKFKNYFKNKSYGFYVTIAVAVFTLVTSIVYADSYGSNDRYMSWAGFAIMLVGIAAAAVLVASKQYEWAPPALALANLIALLLYITNIYNYVAVVMVGIDIASFSTQFIACTTLFAIAIVISIADIFFKQVKEVKQ